jgi:hypothetical protein
MYLYPEWYFGRQEQDENIKSDEWKSDYTFGHDLSWGTPTTDDSVTIVTIELVNTSGSIMSGRVYIRGLKTMPIY